jgi:hypothetical protein
MFQSRKRGQTRFVILPPQESSVPGIFWNKEADAVRYDGLLQEMQRFRGRIYLADGAVSPDDLSADGRHCQPIDDASWHILSLDEEGRICACLRFLEARRARGFDDLWVRHAAICGLGEVGDTFRTAVEREMALARRMRLGFGEVGGWAVTEERRCTVEPLRIVLATYGVLELLGGCTGVATATFRHGSAGILRRIGLAPLEAGGTQIPPYFDPRYGCQMEVLRFDSRYPNPKYREWVRDLSLCLTGAPVVFRKSRHAAARPVPTPAAENARVFENGTAVWA